MVLKMSMMLFLLDSSSERRSSCGCHKLDICRQRNLEQCLYLHSSKSSRRNESIVFFGLQHPIVDKAVIYLLVEDI